VGTILTSAATGFKMGLPGAYRLPKKFSRPEGFRLPAVVWGSRVAQKIRGCSMHAEGADSAGEVHGGFCEA
jgi:hypothetical protein